MQLVIIKKSHCERGLESVKRGWLFVLSSSQALGLSTKKTVACCRSSAVFAFLKLRFEHGKDDDNKEKKKTKKRTAN